MILALAGSESQMARLDSPALRMIRLKEHALPAASIAKRKRSEKLKEGDGILIGLRTRQGEKAAEARLTVMANTSTRRADRFGEA